jgi:hypothetical protein
LFDIVVALDFAAHLAAVEKLVDCAKKENPACFSGRQGSRKLDDLCQILNYLLASLINSSPKELGRILVAWTPNPKPGFPMRTDIHAQRRHEAACECLGYVVNEFIGDEGDC